MKLPFFDQNFANKLKEMAENVQKELDSISASGASGGDMVSITLKANGEVLDFNISDEAYNLGSKEMLTTLIKAAIADAMRNLEAAKKEKEFELATKARDSF